MYLQNKNDPPLIPTRPDLDEIKLVDLNGPGGCGGGGGGGGGVTVTDEKLKEDDRNPNGGRHTFEGIPNGSGGTTYYWNGQYFTTT